ncbi:MAG: 30S ribosomal protein S16 [Patescibacteria group bacterium]|nr:30S ribosomal protein S16 [Patescibacteria group bacterium]
MLRIRLSRVGKKNKAQFRVTVADGRRSPTGKFIEILGHYNPHTKEKVFNNDRIEYWISKGAKPSPTIHNFLVDAKIIKGEKVKSWKPKKKEKEEEKKPKTDEKKEEVKSEEKEAPKTEPAKKEKEIK